MTFVRSYADLFSKLEFDIEQTDLIKHTIDTEAIQAAVTKTSQAVPGSYRQACRQDVG